MKTFRHTAKDQEPFSIDGRVHMFCLHEFREEGEPIERWVQVMKARPEPHHFMFGPAGKLFLGEDLTLDTVTVSLERFLSGGQAQVVFTAPDDVYIGFGRQRREK